MSSQDFLVHPYEGTRESRAKERVNCFIVDSTPPIAVRNVIHGSFTGTNMNVNFLPQQTNTSTKHTSSFCHTDKKELFFLLTTKTENLFQLRNYTFVLLPLSDVVINQVHKENGEYIKGF